MPANLTETAIARLKAEAAANGKRLEVSDKREPGLRLRVTPPSRLNLNVRAIWHLSCRDRLGAMRRFELGGHGSEAPALGIAEARQKARELRVRVQIEGADPNADRKRDRAVGRDARAGVGTLAAALDQYESMQGSKLKSWPHSRKRVALVFKSVLDKPAVKLTAPMLQNLADSYPAQQSASFAVRTLRPALKWLSRRGLVPSDLAHITQPETVNRRGRVLSPTELRLLLPVLTKESNVYAKLFKFILLTALRLNEAALIRWKHVDLDGRKCIPPITKPKKGTAPSEPLNIVVPLSKQAVTLLRSIRPKEVNPEAFIFASRNGTPLDNFDRAGKAIQAASKTAGWHRHDLRRTAATGMGELGIPPHVIESALNHAAIHSRLASTYNVATYKAEVMDALQQLADAFDRIEKGADAWKPEKSA